MKRKKDIPCLLLFLSILTTIVISMCYFIMIKVETYNALRSHCIERLQKEGFKIVEAKEVYCSVVIEIEDFNDFVEKAKELNATIVYFTSVDLGFGMKGERFYVFDEDYKVAYVFKLSGRG